MILLELYSIINCKFYRLNIKRGERLKEFYNKPEIEITMFETEDVITTSGIDNDGNVGEWGPDDLG
ncbi:MAG: hypothetical protein ACLSVP_08860 [Fusobacterium sp.]